MKLSWWWLLDNKVCYLHITQPPKYVQWHILTRTPLVLIGRRGSIDGITFDQNSSRGRETRRPLNLRQYTLIPKEDGDSARRIQSKVDKTRRESLVSGIPACIVENRWTIPNVMNSQSGWQFMKNCQRSLSSVGFQWMTIVTERIRSSAVTAVLVPSFKRVIPE